MPRRPTSIIIVAAAAGVVFADEAALRSAARPGLAAGPPTCVAEKTADGWRIAESTRAVDASNASWRDANVDDVALDLWSRRGTSGEDRARVLREAAGVVAWIDAEVVTVAAPESGDAWAVIETRSRVLEGRARMRVDRTARAKDRIKVPCVLLVKRDEGRRFLQGGDEKRWPWECRLLAGEPAGGGQTVERSGTGAPEDVAARKVSESTLATRAKEWYRARMTLACEYCGGTRELACSKCGGAGWIEHFRLCTDASQSGSYRADCPRCEGKGKRPCSACADGLAESRLRDLLRRFGWFSRPISGFVDEGIEVAISKDGKTAEVSGYVRYAKGDRPELEPARWKLDERGWRVCDPCRPEARAKPVPKPDAAPRGSDRIAPPGEQVASAF